MSVQTAKIVRCVAVVVFACIATISCTKKKTPDGDVFKQPSLVSIAVTPEGGSFVQGTTLQLLVTGRLSDQTRRNLSSGLSWTSSATDIITINSAGLATGVKVGQATLTVTSGTLFATATLQVVPVALQTIAVTPSDGSVFVAGQQPFKATGFFNDKTSRDFAASEIVWRSSDSGIAAIDNTGMATGIAPGTAVISATSGSITGTTTLAVNGVTLTTIVVKPSTLSLVVGTKRSLEVKGIYSDGHTDIVTARTVWSSLSPAVATVDVNGEVTAEHEGTTFIVATFEGRTFRTSVTVANATPISLTVTPINPTMVSGDIKPFKATLAFDNNTSQEVTSQASWTSSNPAVAGVGNGGGDKGIVTAGSSPGTTTIQASFGGKNGTTTLTVIAGVLQSLSITPLNSAIPFGTSKQFTAVGIYDIGLTLDLTQSVTWGSSATSVATINSLGLAHGNIAGTTTITATSGTTSTTTALTVTTATLSALSIAPLFPLIFTGEVREFTAVGTFSDGTTHDLTHDVLWTSDNGNVATIDKDGKAIGVASGKSTIKAEFGTKSSSTELTVTSEAFVSMALVPSDPILPPGMTQSLRAVGTLTDGSTVNLTPTALWSSSNPSIATVDNGLNKGVVTGRAQGITTIFADQGAKFATTSLQVTGSVLTGISITPTNGSIPVGIHLQYAAKGQFSDGSELDITSFVVWSTTNGSLATIDSKGVVTGLSPGGPLGIKAAYLGQTGSTTLTVNTETVNSISVTPAGSILGVNFTRQYFATASYNSGSYDVTTDAVFSSGNVSLLSTSSTGLAVGVSPGNTTIRASFRGVLGSTTVEVKNLVLTAITVTPAGDSVPVGATLQYKATGKYGEDGTEDLTGVVNWSSSVPARAVIGGRTGLVTGVDTGTTIIQAVFGMLSGTTSLTVASAVAKEVTAGGDHSCAVRTDGTLRCWGKNFSGQIGTRNNNSSISADPVSMTSKTAVGIKAGGAHTCSFMQNGSAFCWGSNQKGQLGNGTQIDSNFPQSVPNLAGVKALTAGLSHTCVVLNNKTVRCWGDNSSGQLGDGSSVASSTTPVPVNMAFVPSAIAAGGAHTCVLYEGVGFVDCWGENGSGQLGIGSTTDSPLPVRVNVGGVAIAITAGGNHTCALLSSRTVTCWGDNSSGQLGHSSPNVLPNLVLGLSNVTAVLAGGAHTCALVSSTVKCWGENGTGQLGDGTLVDRNAPVDVSGFLPGEVVVNLSLGGRHTCALFQVGDVACWGSNQYGQLGRNETPTAPTPVDIPGITTAHDVYGGGLHTCVVLNNGVVQCMGDNQAGQLGDGTTVNTDIPVTVSGITASSTAPGNRHTCALLTDGHVQCWGEGIEGQLGNGQNNPSVTPVFVTGITTATAVSSGEGHTCAHLSDDTIWCWGDNRFGQLGGNAGRDSNRPVSVFTATAVSAGRDHTCARVSGGTVQCWGKNDYGQLGNGITTQSLFPVAVADLSSVTAVAAGDEHTCALISGGTVKCWGRNNDGQLGNGSFIDPIPIVPVAVSGTTTALAISAGKAHTCVLLQDTTIQCWGKNDRGQLGTGDTTGLSQNQPRAVSGVTGATSIHAGTTHTCARLADSTVRCWGDASSGQLGNSNNIAIHTTPSKKVSGI